MSTTIKHVRIDHGCLYIFVPEQLLYGPNVVALLKQMRGEAMSKSMTASVL